MNSRNFLRTRIQFGKVAKNACDNLLLETKTSFFVGYLIGLSLNA